MIPLRIFLPLSTLDSYIYSGYLFAVFKDGTLRTIPLAKICQKLISRFPDFETILRLAILRNDWLTNLQAITYYKSTKSIQALKTQWNNCASKELIIELKPGKEWQVLWEIPAMPIYDMRIYAMRLYLAHRKGIHEGSLNFDKEVLLSGNGLKDIFDARTIYITARSGELMFSADDDGLFHGSLWNPEGITKVSDKSYAKKSLRTGWSGFDVINYDSHTHFSYLANEIQKSETRPFIYSFQDESPEKYKIVKIGVRKYSMNQFMEKNSINIEDVIFSYNSTRSWFFVLNDGRLLTSNKLKSKEGQIYLSSRIYNLPYDNGPKAKKIIHDKPYSATVFPAGSVIEFFDKVILIHGGVIQELENNPVISIRTFLTSRRFRRMICITSENGIAIHTIFPTDKEIYEMGKMV